MFHEMASVPATKLNMSWTSLAVKADDSTSRCSMELKINLNSNELIKFKFLLLLLLNLLLPSHLIGKTVDDWLIGKLSVQIPEVG
jgi:hypothetical protein